MVNDTEMYPVGLDLIKEDTLSAVFRNKEELTGIIQGMPPGAVNDLVQEISELPELPKINHSHPFGYYTIPVLTVDFQSKIEAPIPIKFVSNNHYAFRDHHQIRGTLDPGSQTVFLRESEFSSPSRLLGWIGLGPESETIQENTAEHEIRHGIFRHFLKGSFGGGISNIDEGYAWATSYEPHWEGKTNTFIRRVRYEAYEGGFYDPEKIGGYCGLFQIAQAKKIDDVKLLEYMENNEWWAEVDGGWDLNFVRVKKQILGFVGDKGVGPLLKRENDRKKSIMLDFRYGVWQQTLSFLNKNRLAPDINWSNALDEERKIREGWIRSREET